MNVDQAKQLENLESNLTKLLWEIESQTGLVVESMELKQSVFVAEGGGAARITTDYRTDGDRLSVAGASVTRGNR